MIKNLFQNKTDDSYLENLLDEEIYRFNTGDVWRVHEAVTGGLIQGETGLGKSSGPSNHHFNAILKKRYGGMIECMKSDDFQNIKKQIVKAGREADMIHFHAGSNLSFNPLEFELFNPRKGYGQVSSLVNILTMIVEIGKNYKGGGKGGDGNDRFWVNAAERFMARCIHLLRLAKEPVTVQNMRKILISSFKKEDVNRYNEFWQDIGKENLSKGEKDKKWKSYTKWIEANYFLYVFQKANSAELSAEDEEIMHLVGEYFMIIRPDLPEKTMSIVDETFLGSLAEPFLDGILKSHFSEGGVSEELQLERVYEEGKIIVVDFSPKTYGLSGVLASAIMKLAFQRMMETRDVPNETEPKPAFLWIDEYQLVVASAYDSGFQSIARSSLCITMYITQNINGIVSVMGQYSPYQRAKALFGNLGLKIFCGNGCIETNNYASELCGKHLADLKSTSINQGQAGHSYAQTILPKVPADHFNTLKSGRKNNKYIVEAILFKTGKIWKNGKNFIQAEYHQNNY